MSRQQIQEAIERVPEQAIRDTEYCQSNVRVFAEAQMPDHAAAGGGDPARRHSGPPTHSGELGGQLHSRRALPDVRLGADEHHPRARGEGEEHRGLHTAGERRGLVSGHHQRHDEGRGGSHLRPGGVPAMALMAFGLDGLPPVDVLCGAGNKFVAEAKRQLFGRCGIDLLAGPTEILVIADDGADPALVACDLLGQAEHDPHSGVCLICLSEEFARRGHRRARKAAAVLRRGRWPVLPGATRGSSTWRTAQDEAIELSDGYAPEHLELHVRNPGYLLRRPDAITARLFIGEETTVAYGDKTIGTNHILPTSRAARYTGGVWVGKFLKTCTYQRMTPEASVEIAPRDRTAVRTRAHAGTRDHRAGPHRPLPGALSLQIAVILLRARIADVRGLSRRQRHSVRTNCRVTCRCADRPIAPAACLFRRVHGTDGRFSQAILPAVPAGRGVRKTDGDLRLRPLDRPGGLRFIGPGHAIAAVVLVCALLTYGGVSLFVVAFAVYPFAAELFRQSDIPKRLLPATIALGAFTFTMDAMPGSPQIQNIIPAAFFRTNAWAAPWLGIEGSLFVAIGGIAYLEWRRRTARRNGEGYGDNHQNEPPRDQRSAVHPAIALTPLVMVGLINLWLSGWLPARYPKMFDFATAGLTRAAPLDVSKLTAIWVVMCALVAAIAFVLCWAPRFTSGSLREALQAAVGGAMLAGMNVGSEYGFGAVVAALPGFRAVSDAVASAVRDPLVNVAVTSNVLAAITGSSFRWFEHLPGCDGGHVHPSGLRSRHSQRGAASGRFDGQRGDGHPSPQRRDYHPARDYRHDPPPRLQGHLRPDVP